MEPAAQEALQALPRAHLAPEEGRARPRGRGRGRGRGNRSRSRSPLVQRMFSYPQDDSLIEDLCFAVTALLRSCQVSDLVLQPLKKQGAPQDFREECEKLIGRCALLQCPAMLKLKQENDDLARQNETLQEQILDQQIDNEINAP